MKATHNGNCQVCGRLQATTCYRGIAKHGYTVQEWGYNGVCRGSDHAPVQTSTALLDETVQALGLEANRLRSLTADTLPGVMMSRRDPKGSVWNKLPPLKTFVRNEAEFEAWKAEVGPSVCGWRWETTRDSELRRLSHVGESMLQHVLFLTTLRKQCHGQPLPPRTQQ